jgi:hypothetical protein
MTNSSRILILASLLAVHSVHTQQTFQTHSMEHYGVLNQENLQETTGDDANGNVTADPDLYKTF